MILYDDKYILITGIMLLIVLINFTVIEQEQILKNLIVDFAFIKHSIDLE